MSAGMSRILRSALNGRIKISLHAGNPGTNGLPLVMRPQPIRTGSFRVVEGRATLARRVLLGPIPRRTSVRYVGIWLATGEFLLARPLPAPVTLEAGVSVVFERGDLVVELS